MPSDGTIIITDIGHAKLNNAVVTQTKVEITHIAMGDGNGAVYNPGFGQTVLKREKARVPIERRHVAGDNAWRITAEFDADNTPTFWVREIGFIDAEGDMIFLWAGSDVSARQTGAIDYLLDQVLNLDRVKDGVVIVNAPSDHVFDLSIQTAHSMALMQLEQLRQGDAIRNAHGPY